MQFVSDAPVDNGLHDRGVQAQQQIRPTPSFSAHEAGEHPRWRRGDGRSPDATDSTESYLTPIIHHRLQGLIPEFCKK